MTDSNAADRRPDGFRERGRDVTRVEAFVDASFAFAVTLLVISLDGMPADVPELEDALKRIPSFAASFMLLVYFWFAHHTWSRRYGLNDAGSVYLSLLLVFLVLVWVYPLRVLFGVAVGWFSQIALPQEWHIPLHFEFGSFADLRFMFLVYGMAWSSLGIVVALLYRQAWKQRDALRLNRTERLATRAEIARWMWVPVTGAISVAIVFLIPKGGPNWLAGLPGLAYAAMALTGPVMKISERRWQARVDAETNGI